MDRTDDRQLNQDTGRQFFLRLPEREEGVYMAGMRKYPYEQVDVDENKIINTIGENIYRLRTEKGLSIRLLALQAGLDERQLYRIENSEQRVGILSIIKIAKALNVSVDRIVNYR